MQSLIKKNIFILILLFGIIARSLAQEDNLSDTLLLQQTSSITPLDVKVYTLDNGLKVYLNPDYTVKDVFGCVTVLVGSKYEHNYFTGLTNLLVNLMDKGTPYQGTINFDKEKPLLDSMMVKYDSYIKANNKKEQNNALEEAKLLSDNAAEYCIPNDFYKILKDIGGYKQGNFVDYDNISFYSYFPSESIEKWITLYSDQIKYPIFRGFPESLDKSINEINVNINNNSKVVVDNIYSAFYRNHPYGKYNIEGLYHHLRKISFRKIKEYYDTYFVANNMAVILCGNFNEEIALNIIKKYFADLPTRKIYNPPSFTEDNLEGNHIISKRISPYRMGAICYRTVPMGSDNEIAVKLCNILLSNNAENGYLDYKRNSKNIGDIFLYEDIRKDFGATIIYYTPKKAWSKFKKTETEIIQEINNLEKGKFKKENLEAAKYILINNYIKEQENIGLRTFNISNSFVTDKPLLNINEYTEKVKKVSMKDITNVAKLYFNSSGFLSFYARKKYFFKKDKNKENIFSLESFYNIDSVSYLRKIINDLPVYENTNKFVNINQEVSKLKTADDKTVFYTTNPLNNIFTLKIKFDISNIDCEYLDIVAKYIENMGCKRYDANEFKSKLRSYGSSYYITIEENKFVINISGFDENYKKIIKMFKPLINEPLESEELLKSLIKPTENKSNFYKQNPNNIIDALYDYSVYGQKSKYLNNIYENIKIQDIIQTIEKIRVLEPVYHYVGTIDMVECVNSLRQYVTFNRKTSNLPSKEVSYLKRNEISKNTFKIVSNDELNFNNFIIYIKGDTLQEKNKLIVDFFNKYYFQADSSLLVKNLQHKSSLTYNPIASFNIENNYDGYSKISFATHKNNTLEVVKLLVHLFDTNYVDNQCFEYVKNKMIKASEGSDLSFRNYSDYVEKYLEKGFNSDPNQFEKDLINNVSINDMVNFWENNIKNKNILFCIYGNISDEQKLELSKLGEVSYLKIETIIKK